MSLLKIRLTPNQAKEFFNSPREHKQEYAIHSAKAGGLNRGWVHMQGEALDPESQKVHPHSSSQSDYPSLTHHPARRPKRSIQHRPSHTHFPPPTPPHPILLLRPTNLPLPILLPHALHHHPLAPRPSTPDARPKLLRHAPRPKCRTWNHLPNAVLPCYLRLRLRLSQPFQGTRG